MFHFLDGQVIFAEDEDDISRMVSKLAVEYKNADLSINIKKTEYLIAESVEKD